MEELNITAPCSTSVSSVIHEVSRSKREHEHRKNNDSANDLERCKALHELDFNDSTTANRTRIVSLDRKDHIIWKGERNLVMKDNGYDGDNNNTCWR